jgi:hypothetical protein
MSVEQVRTGKETFMAYFMVLSKYLPAKIEVPLSVYG